MANDLKKLRKKLEKELESKRYEHTLGVAYTAAMLARIHGEDCDKALIAGMLHDCAKCIDHKQKIKLCEKNNMTISDVERRNPFLLHSKAGRVLAIKEYDIEDEDILNAIEYHTTGRPDMSLLEKIIFIADYIEPGRKHAENLNIIRKMAFEDIDSTLLKILEDTLNYLKSTGNEIDDMTQITYDYYSKRNEVNA